MAKQLVFVEVGEDRPIRILRTNAEAWRLPPEKVQQWPKSEAVKAIRDQVFDRSRGECEFCGRRLTKDTGHMHEKRARGKRDKEGNYGEISLANSVFICYSCHILGEHGDRKFQSSRIKERQ